MALKKVKEIKRREVRKQIDSKPSFNHKLSFNFIKPYVLNKYVLDVGCWSGQFETLAKDHVKQIVGIDPGNKAIELARKRLAKYNNVSFDIGKAEKLQFKDNTFDTVVMLEVLEHLPKYSEKKALKEINRVLKSAGYLILSTPNSNIFSILLDPAYFLIGHRHYSYKQLSDLLQKTNFKISSVHYRGGFAHLITSNIEMIFKHIFKKKFNRPQWLNNRIESEFTKGGFAQIMIVAKSK